MQSCPNLEQIDPSAVVTHQYFTEKRILNLVPSTITELRCVGIQSKNEISGLLGKGQTVFHDIGRLPRAVTKGPYWKRDDCKNVTKVHIEPTFLAWTKMEFTEVPRPRTEKAKPSDEDVEVEPMRWEIKKMHESGWEQWGNLQALNTISLDCREVGMYPYSVQELKLYADDKYRQQTHYGHQPNPFDLDNKMWSENRSTNLWFWAMLGKTPQLPRLEKLEIDLQFNPWAPRVECSDKDYDEWVSGRVLSMSVMNSNDLRRVLAVLVEPVDHPPPRLRS
jgi:hypothetical protein